MSMHEDNQIIEQICRNNLVGHTYQHLGGKKSYIQNTQQQGSGYHWANMRNFKTRKLDAP